ncbi:MAG: hypothetical protein DYH05_07490, partial [Acidobacteria bacterium ACB1]|nr:hypothetical protein [Acidobacteria bacterium ACB1]
DFGLQAVVDCPVWEVEAATPFLRRCFDNNYAIRYCNTGTVASDGMLQVVLDPSFSYLSSSMVREVALLGGDYSEMVPGPVGQVLARAISKVIG